MQANGERLLESCHDCSDGGMAVTLAEAMFGTGFGANINIGAFHGLSVPTVLFAESHSRFVVSIRPENKRAFEKLMSKDAMCLGNVTEIARVNIARGGTKVLDVDVATLIHAWNTGLQG